MRGTTPAARNSPVSPSGFATSCASAAMPRRTRLTDAVGGSADRRHADDRIVEVDAAGGAEPPRVAEGEDAAVGGDRPGAVSGRSAGHAGGGMIEEEAA